MLDGIREGPAPASRAERRALGEVRGRWQTRYRSRHRVNAAGDRCSCGRRDSLMPKGGRRACERGVSLGENRSEANPLCFVSAECVQPGTPGCPSALCQGGSLPCRTPEQVTAEPAGAGAGGAARQPQCTLQSSIFLR